MTHLVQHYFSQSAQKYPNKPAVTCEDVVLTYNELELFSNAFARAIKAAGVSPGELVPFYMKKSTHSIKSILSILKADATYVPIDVHSPAQRLLSILDTCKAKVVVVDNASEADALSIVAGTTITVLNIEKFSGGDSSAIEYKNLSIDLAYVLFTSGSTGTPKGVMIPHQAIIDYIDFCVNTYGINADDQISNHAPLYFDNSTFDIYTAFKAGATLHLIHEELNSVLPFLVKWLGERKISVFFCVPSVLTMLLKSRRLKPESFPALRHLLAAGEVLPPVAIREWMKLYPHVQFTNMYGPTEITVDCTYYTIQSVPEADCTAIPIGKARPNMELLIRTENGEIIRYPEADCEGELLVRGLAVSYGYLGDETRTQQAFIQNPYVALFKDPLYCTGDLVRMDQDGNFLYLGRMDTQIKYLGYRIELGEIESVIATIDGVVEVVVVFNNSGSEDQKHIAALISLTDTTDLATLQHTIKSKLPSYMVPTLIKQTHEEFPRTPNGKYDRKQILSILSGATQ